LVKKEKELDEAKNTAKDYAIKISHLPIEMYDEEKLKKLIF
jgi:hypothetical protein